MKTVKLTINGKAVTAPEGMNLLEAARTNGIPVEHFCYHRYLAVDGNCRTCMAELSGPRGPSLAISCNTKVAEGMVARFDSPEAVRAQKAALEFLLLDHPLDCPICDKAGECLLQDHYQAFGLYDPEHPLPRHFKGGKALDIGKHIILDQERCVLCTRCIRFLDLVPRTSELCIVNRGHDAVLDIFPGRRLDNPYSGNVTDVCPVGALTLKEFRFRQRVWFLKKTESVCPGCSRGCNITIEHNRGRLWRFMPRENPDVNLTWMCDEGRLSFAGLQEERLLAPRVSQVPGATSEEAWINLVKLLKDIKPDRVAGLASPWASCEDLYAMRRLFTKRFRPENLAAVLPPEGGGDDVLRTAQKHPNEQGLKLLSIPTNNRELLERMAEGKFEAVLILENDLLSHGNERVEKAFQSVPLTVALSSVESATATAASMALPVTAFFEKDGTFVNSSGRLQRFQVALPPAADGAQDACDLLSRLEAALSGNKGTAEGPDAVFAAMAREIPSLKGLMLRKFPPTGVLLGLESIAPAPFRGVVAPTPNVLPAAPAGKEAPG